MLGASSPRIHYLSRYHARNKNSELSPTERTVLYHEVATLSLGRCACDGQAQAGPETAVVQTLEFAKHAVARCERDARASVADDQSHAAVLDTPDDRYWGTGRRVDAHVFQHVAQGLIEQARVKSGELQRIGHVERQRAVAEHGHNP